MRRSILALTALLLSPACATGDGMQEKLRDATTGYNRSVRWRDFDRAAAHIPAESQAAFYVHQDEIGDELVIVDYELTRLDLDKSTGIAASRAQISWHTDRRLILETTFVDQLWQWHDGHFVLVDERRSGGTPLTLFAEPGEPVHPFLPGLEAYRETHSIGKDERTQRRERRQARRASRGADPRAGATAQRGASPPGPTGPTASSPGGPAAPVVTADMALDAPPAPDPSR